MAEVETQDVILWVDIQAVDITMVPMTVDHTEAHMMDMI